MRIPELEHLPPDQRKEALAEAQRAVLKDRAEWRSPLAQLLIGFAAIAATVAGVFSGLALADWLFGGTVPRWVVACFCVAVGLTGVVWAAGFVDRWVIRPRVWRLVPSLCDHCGYNITGNESGVCPECGTPLPPRG